MRNYWVTSDTHFEHNNIIKYCNRPFQTYWEMDNTLVENWNSVVKQGDYVYHLGDVFMEAPRGEGSRLYRDNLLKRLNGRITLILGNHDNVKYLSGTGRFHEILMWKPWNPDKKKPLLLSHVPLHKDSVMWETRGGVNVHGHIHNKKSPDGPYRNVCVEMTNYTPINIEELR